MNKKLKDLSIGTLFTIPSDSGIRGIDPRIERTVDPSLLHVHEVIVINRNKASDEITSIRIKDCSTDSVLRIEKRYLDREVDLDIPKQDINDVNEPELNQETLEVRIDSLDLNDLFHVNSGALGATDENGNTVLLEEFTTYEVVNWEYSEFRESRYVQVAKAFEMSDYRDKIDDYDEDFDEEPEEPKYYFLPNSTPVVRVNKNDLSNSKAPRLDESTAGSIELGQSFNDFTIQVESMIAKQVAALTAIAFDKALVDAIQREVNFISSAPAEFRMNLHPNTYQQNDSFYINLFKNMADVDDRRKGCIRDANALVLTYAEFRQIVNLVFTEKKKAGEKEVITLLPKREDEVENMQLSALEHFMFLKMNNKGVDEVATAILWNLVPQDKPVLLIGL